MVLHMWVCMGVDSSTKAPRKYVQKLVRGPMMQNQNGVLKVPAVLTAGQSATAECYN